MFIGENKYNSFLGNGRTRTRILGRRHLLLGAVFGATLSGRREHTHVEALRGQEPTTHISKHYEDKNQACVHGCQKSKQSYTLIHHQERYSYQHCMILYAMREHVLQQ